MFWRLRESTLMAPAGPGGPLGGLQGPARPKQKAKGMSNRVSNRRQQSSSSSRKNRNSSSSSKCEKTWEYSGSLADGKARVAIIGGGISGLCCAQGLLERKVRCTVFDTGENGAGGRLATRRAGDPSHNGFTGEEVEGQCWDHACQWFTCDDPEFDSVVKEWSAKGIVREWEHDNSVGSLDAVLGTSAIGGGGNGQKWIGRRGMRDVAEDLLQSLREAHPPSKGAFEVSRPAWVNKLKPREEGWEVFARGKTKGVFDMVVIAHNGKCANRLVKPTGAERTLRQLRSLKLSAIWALMVEFESTGTGQPPVLPSGLQACFVSNSDVISFVGNQSAKYGPSKSGTECFTLFSTERFGRQHKVPQEAVPAAKAAEVRDLMLGALFAIPGVSKREVGPAWRAQLWGAALPTNALGEPFILEREKRIAVCGDWLTGSGVQDAALSGFALAAAIAEGSPSNAGLDAKLRPLAGVTPIGSFY